MPTSLRLWFDTLRHHKPSQLGRRAWSRIKRRAIGQRAASEYVRRRVVEVDGINPGLELAELWKWKRRAAVARMDIEQARSILSGKFTFIGLERHLQLPLDWTIASWPDAPALWKFHLHSFEFLISLLAAAEDEDAATCTECAWTLVEDWVRQNPPGSRKWEQGAWHPYCISRRVIPWLMLAARDAFATPRAARLIQSLAAQLLFLEDNLERDIGGNHLIANLKALLFGAACFQGAAPERWLEHAWPALLDQLDDQILPSGEHFERSPMYHTVVLQDLLEVQMVVGQVYPSLADELQSKICAMADHLEAILHPDGQIPLFGDSVFDATSSPRAVLQQARSVLKHPATEISLEASIRDAADRLDSRERHDRSVRRLGDYWVCREAGRFLILDGGLVAPDHLPAHGHADLLTIEASVGSQRLLVDSGTCCYEPGSMRNYCRSTAAHNTLLVDGADQCDTWSSFRMGHRGHPVDSETGEWGPVAWARASHDAYRRCGVPRVSRWIASVANGGPWLCVDDAASHGTHQFTERLHLHPNVAAEFVSPNLVRLRFGNRTLWLTLVGPLSRSRITRGWYCPRFGSSIGNSVVEWTVVGSASTALGWAIWFSPTPGQAQVTQRGSELQLNWQHERQKHSYTVFPTSALGETER